MVKIRLSRFGSAHNPHYRIVVTDSRRPRDGGAGWRAPASEHTT